MVKYGTCPKTADICGFRFLEERNVPPAIKRGAGPRSAAWHENPYSRFEACLAVAKRHRGTGDEMVGATRKRIGFGLVTNAGWKIKERRTRNGEAGRVTRSALRHLETEQCASKSASSRGIVSGSV
jgi:hypothetical protein